MFLIQKLKINKIVPPLSNPIFPVTAVLSLCILLQGCREKDTNTGNVLFEAKSLEEAFLAPGKSAKPWVYWYWMNANATMEGVTRDLEAMAEMGIAGAYLMPIGHAGPQTLVDPPANPLSEPWWDLVTFATKEADRLGLKLAMNACDGWALAGGPWITPELSMQEVVSSQIHLTGGTSFNEPLPLPKIRENYYRDIAVLAFPAPEGSGLTSIALKPKTTTNIPGLDPNLLIEGADKIINLSQEGWIQYEFDQPFTCRSVYIEPGQRIGYQLHRAELQVSDDGIKFRSLGRLIPSEFHGWQDEGMGVTHSIPETTAQFFRFSIGKEGTPDISENHEGSKARNRDGLNVQLIELRSTPSISHWEGKAGYRWRRSPWTTSEQVPDKYCVPKEAMLDLSKFMDADGRLRWEVPEGEWTVMRFGYTSTGIKNGPGGTGAGLECDKFNPEAAELQFNGWFGEALNRVGPDHAGKVLWMNHTDSWEAISQNWSPLFREEFIKRRGYDPVPWLPAMQGVPVASAEMSERFLFDVRRTIADLVCDNFYDPFTKLGTLKGAAFSAENIAPTMMADGLQHFRYADIPMGEFWLNSVNQDKPNDILDAVRGGHIYGKRIIGAEAFTQISIRWNEDPYWLKPMGDYNFAMGINRFVLHVWAHQAFDRKPGVTLAGIGTFFSGNQTWFKPGIAWIDYLTRCSSMLQQGLPVEDVCFFIGEEQPARSYLRKDLPMELPDGYSYGCINQDALLNLARVSNGKLLMPDGLAFHVLVLPPAERMSPELADKIGEFARAGLPVIGSRPSASISLTSYPECDEKVREIVEKQWKPVHSGIELQTILADLDLQPDVIFNKVEMIPVYRQEMEYHSTPFVWNHRQTRNEDFYFLSNQERFEKDVEVEFRISGKIPEIWDPSTATIKDAEFWRIDNGRTILKMHFDPAGSVFVVFRRKANQRDIKAGTEVKRDEIIKPLKINGSWTVSFPPEQGVPESIWMDSLASLSNHSNDRIKYFSGTATYKNNFELSEFHGSGHITLDLGKVANLAEVWINEIPIGIAWKPPYRLDISQAVQEGENEVRIQVTNTWKNRLIGDAGLPAGQRIGWTLAAETWFDPDTQLEESGLLGPLKLIYKTDK